MMDGQPHPGWGYWAARTMDQTLATAAVMQQAQNNANAIALAQATAAASVSQTRMGLVAAAQAHIAAVLNNPALAGTPDVLSHLAAAQQILATIT